MIQIGNWEAKFSKNFPQKIATAVAEEIELAGASYNAVAYLGSQQVNGINHAVLAEQTVLNGKDSKNAVVLVYNEKPNSADVSLVAIHRIVESGGELGGTKVDISFDIPAEALKTLQKALEGWVGAKVEPVVYLGQQVKYGTDYIMIAEVTPVKPDSDVDLAIITTNDLNENVHFDKLLEDPTTRPVPSGCWIIKGKRFGAPLGEWP